MVFPRPKKKLEAMMRRSSITRRTVVKYAALGTTVLAAPYVQGAYAAGRLTLGCWDHWVPGANNTLTRLCSEWSERNKVEVRIDYITSQGEKDKLTAAAEAQAGTGHDIMSHRDWNIQLHQRALEPLAMSSIGPIASFRGQARRGQGSGCYPGFRAGTTST
jgi:hypothetical protein